MQFIDEVRISVKAGNGGNGCISFRREKFIPKGGPDGGNGGRGGTVLIRADHHLNTLLDFKYKRHYKASRGEHGRGRNQEGKSGKDELMRVPCGTLIKDFGTGDLLADLTRSGDEFIVAKGGKGGKGNAEFATSTNQAPRIAEPGTPGEERELLLELKLLADVGLVGLPNAGKSTLISVISAAKPKIADYPFTTLTPNLGMVYYREGRSFTVADIPGLIQGAHKGKGLGTQFLRHIERTKVLVFLVEAVAKNPKKDYKILLDELGAFGENLLKKPRVVALTKKDIADEALIRKVKKLSFGRGIPVHCISAIAQEGLEGLLQDVWKRLEKTVEVMRLKERR